MKRPFEPSKGKLFSLEGKCASICEEQRTVGLRSLRKLRYFICLSSLIAVVFLSLACFLSLSFSRASSKIAYLPFPTRRRRRRRKFMPLFVSPPLHFAKVYVLERKGRGERESLRYFPSLSLSLSLCRSVCAPCVLLYYSLFTLDQSRMT